MAVLGRRMSTHILISSGFFGFGVTTSGETHGVGPVQGSMMPCFVRLSSSWLTFSRMWNGYAFQAVRPVLLGDLCVVLVQSFSSIQFH